MKNMAKHPKKLTEKIRVNQSQREETKNDCWIRMLIKTNIIDVILRMYSQN